MYTDLGLAILRIVVGAILLAHGLQKFGFLGGGGIQGTVSWLEGGLGIWPAEFWAWVVAGVETLGGALMIVGLLGFIAPFAIAADMVVAAVTVHAPKGFWNTKGGYEYNIALGAAAIASGLLGYGAWSLDAVFGVALPDWLLVGWAVASVVGVLAALLSRNVKAGAAA
jgi:putative oxidoreductase